MPHAQELIRPEDSLETCSQALSSGHFWLCQGLTFRTKYTVKLTQTQGRSVSAQPQRSWAGNPFVWFARLLSAIPGVATAAHVGFDSCLPDRQTKPDFLFLHPCAAICLSLLHAQVAQVCTSGRRGMALRCADINEGNANQTQSAIIRLAASGDCVHGFQSSVAADTPCSVSEPGICSASHQLSFCNQGGS